jgi:tetratricopeptide (TPR) repeat protein
MRRIRKIPDLFLLASVNAWCTFCVLMGINGHIRHANGHAPVERRIETLALQGKVAGKAPKLKEDMLPHHRAQALLRQGQHAEANDIFDDMLNRGPQPIDRLQAICAGKATIALSHKKYEEAAIWLKQETSLPMQHRVSRYQLLIQALLYSSNPREAVKAVESALQTFPNDATLMAYSAELCRSDPRYTLAALEHEDAN